VEVLALASDDAPTRRQKAHYLPKLLFRFKIRRRERKRLAVRYITASLEGDCYKLMFG
jgi:hypothetical protein